MSCCRAENPREPEAPAEELARKAAGAAGERGLRGLQTPGCLGRAGLEWRLSHWAGGGLAQGPHLPTRVMAQL